MFRNLYTDKGKRCPFRLAVYEADSDYGTGAGRKTVLFVGTDVNDLAA